MIDNNELFEAVQQYKTTKVASEKLGKLLLDLHNSVLLHRNFNRYPTEVKEDMRSYSLMRVLKRGLDSFNVARKDECWSYYTHGIFMNYYAFLKQYYNKMNKEREFKVKIMNQFAAENGKAQNFE